MEQLKHFRHEHLLNLVQLRPDHNNENSDKEEDDEDNDEIVVEEAHVGECNMCKEGIYSFHLCYYACQDCDYSIHKLCAQLPLTLQNHPSHPDHNLSFYEKSSFFFDDYMCSVCKTVQETICKYYCSGCTFDIDIVCATMYRQKMDHPSHPHQLKRCFGRIISRCNACNSEHSGTFYQCTTCFYFRIHLDCALLPPKLLIEQSTYGSFGHPHMLTLFYYFPYSEAANRFFPHCRVCDKSFDINTWHYRCDRCRYYVHVDCATSRKEAFLSSILMPAGRGRTFKNYKDDDHPNLIRCPLPDESVNLLMHRFINKGELFIKEKVVIETYSHPHPLILVEKLLNESVSLHDTMKKVHRLCDGCVRPVTDVPFYKCSQHHCGFILHEWCTRLPSEIQHHPDHPEHALVLLSKIPEKLLGVFWCDICSLPSNGFAYGCRQCAYYVDVHCGFIPNVITHEAHPDHLLLRYKTSANRVCKACSFYLSGQGFHCPTCDFYLHTKCALLLPKMIRHKYDKHPLSLMYYPAENHNNEYFCEICEDELNPNKWFYHCSTCASSMHTACSQLKLKGEQSEYMSSQPIFLYINVKFGGTHEIKNHPHPLTFLQGIKADGQCMLCNDPLFLMMTLQGLMIFKCTRCKLVLHDWCVQELIQGSSDGRLDPS